MKEKIPGKVVEKSFKKCCISNYLDSADDDVLWEVSENDYEEDDSTSNDDDSCSSSDENSSFTDED